MKTLGIELKVPFIYRKEIRRELHQAIEDLIANEIPACINEEKKFTRSTFTLSYWPTNSKQLECIKDFERQLESLVSVLNEE